MSKVNDAMDEAVDKLAQLTDAPVILKGRIVKAYGSKDILDMLKGMPKFPGVGVVYEGMRSQPEEGKTAKVGVSAEMVLAFILVQQGDAILQGDQKKTISIDYLNGMRDQFIGERSTATGHFWHFMVESPAEVVSGMVCWIQRWSLPVQLPPKPRP